MNPHVALLHQVLPETDLAGAPDCEAAVETQGGVSVLTVPPGAAVDQPTSPSLNDSVSESEQNFSKMMSQQVDDPEITFPGRTGQDEVEEADTEPENTPTQRYNMVSV